MKSLKRTEPDSYDEAKDLAYSSGYLFERAKGAAEAIKIENGSITPTYIQYLWVRQQGMSGDSKIIYIPTEAGLPILEAGRTTNK